MNETERRENHKECGDNKARKYTRQVSGGEVWYCHHCAGRGFVPNGFRSPRETVSNIVSIRQFGNTVVEQVERCLRLPSDADRDVPTIGLGWLYKYYITDEEIKQLGICYSEKYQRLILPVYNENQELIYWQGRSLKPPYTKDNPKYINVRQSGARNIFFKRYNGLSLDCLVIVEDILSAIRVGRFANSLALLGSYFPISILNEFRDYEKIIIYLDNDKYKEAIKTAIRFNKLTWKQFIVKQHQLDPKELPQDSLEDFLIGDL